METDPQGIVSCVEKLTYQEDEGTDFAKKQRTSIRFGFF